MQDLVQTSKQRDYQKWGTKFFKTLEIIESIQ